MVDDRHMPGHLAAGDQKVLSGPDVVESLAALDLAANSCHRKCHGILNAMNVLDNCRTQYLL